MVGQARERNFNGPGIYLWSAAMGHRVTMRHGEKEREERKKERKNEKGSMTLANGSFSLVQWRTLERGKKKKEHTKRMFPCTRKIGVASRVLQCWDEKRSAPGPFIFQPSNVFLRVSIASCHPSFFLSRTTLKVIAKNSSDRARDTEARRGYKEVWQPLRRAVLNGGIAEFLNLFLEFF